jgi:hypothetical protein
MMTTMMRALLSCSALLCGCHALPGIEEGKLGETGLEDTGREPLPERIELAFSVALQRGDWGQSVTRCQVELAFLEAGQHDGLFASAGGVDITYPTEPGTCAYTSFAEQPAAVGLWSVRGTRRAAESIWLHGDEGSLELALSTDSRGRYTYALQGCDEASFPFARVLDLEVPGHDADDGLEAFEAEQAFAVGPDLAITALPDTMDEQGRLVLAPGEDLALSWASLQALPEVDGVAVAQVTYLMLRNFHPGDERPLEALACLPSETTATTISAADLALLEPSGDPTTGDPYIAFQVDAWYEGPPVHTPWRSTSRVLSVVTEGGIVILEP